MKNRVEGVIPQRLHDCVHMIGHHTPCAEFVTVLLEETKPLGDQVCHTPVPHPGRARVPIKNGINILDPRSDEPPINTTVEVRVRRTAPAEQVLAPFRQSADGFAGQRIGEAKSDEVHGALDFEVRQVAAGMAAGQDWHESDAAVRAPGVKTADYSPVQAGRRRHDDPGLPRRRRDGA